MGKNLDNIISNYTKKLLDKRHNNKIDKINNIIDDAKFTFFKYLNSEIDSYLKSYVPKEYIRTDQLKREALYNMMFYNDIPEKRLYYPSNIKVIFNISSMHKSKYPNDFNGKGDVISLWETGWNANAMSKRIYRFSHYDGLQWITKCMDMTKFYIRTKYKIDIDISYISAYDIYKGKG